jgi:hypothetical protein
MLHSKKWMYMLHGNIARRYTSQDMEIKAPVVEMPLTPQKNHT